MLSVHGALHRIASTLQSKGNLSSSLNILPCPALPCRPAQFKGKTVLLGVDDMDVFKGIELKLQAFEQVLAHHPEWRGKLVLVQVTSAARWGCGSRAGGVVSVGGEGAWGDQLLVPREGFLRPRSRCRCCRRCRAPGKDVEELQHFVMDLVEGINAKYRQPGYEPVVWLERSVPLYERIALYSIAGGWVGAPALPGAPPACLRARCRRRHGEACMGWWCAYQLTGGAACRCRPAFLPACRCGGGDGDARRNEPCSLRVRRVPARPRHQQQQ